MPDNKKVLLVILDGFGCSDLKDHNAVFKAQKPFLDSAFAQNSHCEIQASGGFVGLPDGVMGNSEVGHLNLGAGRVVKQELTKIGDYSKEEGFDSLPIVQSLFSSDNGSLHLMGLLSDGGVHSHQEHLYSLLEAAKKLSCQRPIYIHAITDGRDTPPKSAGHYLAQLEKKVKEIGIGQIATVGGRFYLMDRDNRWERTQKGYQALTQSQEHLFDSAEEAINHAYKVGETDEFVIPRQIKGFDPISNNDSVLFFNFRADRARQISRALAKPDFKDFDAPIKVNEKQYVTFTQYEESFSFPVLFPPESYNNILGQLVAEKGEAQLRIAETEKYAHVTYFFNGGEENVFPKEDRILVPSPKEVRTYDEKPEMSAETVTEKLVSKLKTDDYKLIVLNFANSDMVGHTGVENAAIEAVEVIDRCLKKVCDQAASQGYDVLITADHGNSECMVDPKTGEPHTAHTTNPVPLIWISTDDKKYPLENGKLADIAPTILEIFRWPKPKEMTGKSLISPQPL